MLAIGTVLNVPDPSGKKALWILTQQATFLGFIVDSAEHRCLLPAQNQRDIAQLATRILQSSQVSNRQLAQLAGKMIAAAPAVPLGPLFARAVCKAMTGQTGWDTVYPSQQAALADIQCYLDAITASQGSRW